MDEPVSSLDVDAKVEVLSRLESVMRVLAAPVIYVSHDPAEVRRLADRVVTMRAGRVGPPEPMSSATLDEAALDALDPADVRALALAALRAGLTPT
jgi:molybdate transport system ATP-binding protein